MNVDTPHRRLLLLSTDLGIGGGAEQQVLDLSLEFRARGWQVRIVSMVPPSLVPAGIAAAGIEVASLEMRKGWPGLGGLRRLIGLMRAYQPHVMHCHMTHANLLGRTARMFCDVPVLISTLHGLRMYSVKGGRTWFREMAHRFTDPWSDATTTVCGAAAAICIETRSAPRHKLSVMHNGVNTARFAPGGAERARIRQELGISESQFVWLAVGRLEPAKDYATMLRAFSQTIAAGGTSVLLICGTGSMEEPVRALVEELRLSSSVSLLGLRTDIPEVMAAADAFVLSSRTEGLPMVLLQAGACGLPVVATAVGGNSEALIHGQTGLLAPPGKPSALAAAMLEITAMPVSQRLQMGAASREFIRRSFAIEEVAARWEQIYELHLARNAGRRRRENIEEGIAE